MPRARNKFNVFFVYCEDGRESDMLQIWLVSRALSLVLHNMKLVAANFRKKYEGYDLNGDVFRIDFILGSRKDIFCMPKVLILFSNNCEVGDYSVIIMR